MRSRRKSKNSTALVQRRATLLSVTAVLAVVAAIVAGLTIRPAGHAETARPEWNVECGFDHALADDPIRFFGQAGAAPMNDFFGNKTTNANSTGTSINAGAGSCAYIPDYDRSAYWVPAIMYTNPDGSVSQYPGSNVSDVVYYSRPGGTAGPKVQPFPKGLKMLAGDPNATSAQSQNIVTFNCSGGASSAGIITNCGGTSSNSLRGNVTFPSCWDGVHLDSADHKSHMAYANATTGACPADHPVSLPQILYDLHWQGMGGGPNYFLSSGGIYSMYGEFIEGWDTRLEQGLIDNCVNNAQNSCHLIQVGTNGDVTINGGTLLFNLSSYPATPTPSSTPTPTPTVSAAAKPGDINGDGSVNVIDLSTLLSNWGKTTASCDFNHDGTVNVLDLSVLLSHWG